MDRLLFQHQLHHSLPWHVLTAVGAELGIAGTSVHTRYKSFLRRLELQQGAVILTNAERDAIRRSGTLGAAHAVLQETGRIIPFALLERALWREGGDRNLVELRNGEVARRVSTRAASGCSVCTPASGEAAA